MQFTSHVHVHCICIIYIEIYLLHGLMSYMYNMHAYCMCMCTIKIHSKVMAPTILYAIYTLSLYTIAELLVQFFTLDSNVDDALDYFEFSVFAGDTDSSQRIFFTMDSDHNSLLTYQEISDAIVMLEQQTTEGTEDTPDSSESDSTGVYNEGESPGTTPPLTSEQTAATDYGPAATDQTVSKTQAPEMTSPDTTASVESPVNGTGSEKDKESVLKAWKTLSGT